MRFKTVEDIQLYKGIFWIKDTSNPDKNLCFKIECNSEGASINDGLLLNSKNGKTYNYKLLWERLSKSITENKPYNYYPRGRVEIHNGVAKINGGINNSEITNFLKNEFNLTPHNGIKSIKIITDSSNHYLCYLDDGWKPDNRYN